MTTVQIHDEIAAEYASRARAQGCDLSVFIEHALIAQLEDIEDTETAIERLRNPQPSLSLEEVKRNLGLDD